jgi:MFS family permease
VFRRDFRLLLLAQVTSQFGTQISSVALPLLAVVTLGGGPFEVGLISAASTVSFALVGLQAGAWVDRQSRRPILIAADLTRALLLATIPLAAALDVLSIAHLVVVAALTGFARVFFDVAYQSYLPTVVGKDRVLSGNSFMETIRASGQFAGPGLGGWLISLIGAATVIFIQAVTLLVSALCLLRIRATEAPVTAPRRGLRREVAEGLAFVRGNRILLALAWASGVCNFTFALASAVTIVFMAQELAMSATIIGLVMAAASLASMAGAAITPWLARVAGSARIVWLALIMPAPLGFIPPFVNPGLLGAVLLIVSFAAGELGQIVYSISALSLRQRLCPDRLLGRVNATMRFLIMATFPIGALVGGALGEVVGLRGALLITCVVGLLAPLPAYLVLRGRHHVEELQPW